MSNNGSNAALNAAPLNAAANGAKNNGAKNNGAKNNNAKAAAAAAALAAANGSDETASQTSTAAVNGSQNANAVGGRRRTKKAKKVQKGGKISKGASKWNQFVMRTFKEMRKKNKTVKLMDAMKECSKQKKKGIKY